MDKHKYFSVTKKDLRVDFFRAGGKGGQHQNKTSSACRITHAASGAVGESRSERSQHQNRKIALHRLAATRKFKLWVRAQAAAIEAGYREIEQKVEKVMAGPGVKTEYIVKYTCDTCGKSETIASETQGKLPAWVDDLGNDDHICSGCLSRGR